MSGKIHVKAVGDIRSEGGLLLAKDGVMGLVDPSLVPRREHHVGKLPVRWGAHKRSFWVDPIFVRPVDPETGGLLRSCRLEDHVPRPPNADTFSLEIPEGNGAFDFGSNLQKVRKARGMSQEELARGMRSLGAHRISQTTVSNWENRRDNPSGHFLRAASKALAVPAYVFFMDLDCLDVEESLSFVSELKEAICE